MIRRAPSPRACCVKRRTWLAFSRVMLLGVASCGSPTDPLRPADVVGAYALASVGGRPVPVQLPGEVVVSDVFTLDAEGTWSETEETRTPDLSGTPNTQYFSGTWVLDAGSRTLSMTTGLGSQSYTLSYAVRDGGRTLNLPTRDGEWRYVRQR